MYETNSDYERALSKHAPGAAQAEQAGIALLTAGLPISARLSAAASPWANPTFYVDSQWRDVASTVHALLASGKEVTAEALLDAVPAESRWRLERQIGMLSRGVDAASVGALVDQASRLPEIHLRRAWIYEGHALSRVSYGYGGAAVPAMVDQLGETFRRLTEAGALLDGRDRPAGDHAAVRDLPPLDQERLPLDLGGFGSRSEHQLAGFEEELVDVCRTDPEALLACRVWLRPDDFTNATTQRLWREAVRDLDGGKLSRSGDGATGHQYGPDYDALHVALGSARRRTDNAVTAVTKTADSPNELGDTAELLRRNGQVLGILTSTHREITRLLCSPESQRALDLLRTPPASRPARPDVPDVSHLLDPAVPGGSVHADRGRPGPARSRIPGTTAFRRRTG